MHVLMVCTGNICRSPSAERLLLAHAQRLGVTGLTVASAGTRAVVGYGMEPIARAVLGTLGGDPTLFRARQLTTELCTEADLILTMTTRHRAAVLTAAPRVMRRTFSLLEAQRLLDVPLGAPDEQVDPRDVTTLATRLVEARGRQPHGDPVDDITDPIGRERAVFEQVGNQLDAACVAVARAIHDEQLRAG